MPDHSSAGGACRGLRALPADPPWNRRCGARSDTGAVTAETAVVLPVLLLLTLGLVWLLSLAVTQVRVVDAARETARALAREEPGATAVGLGRRVAPEASRFTVNDEGDTLRVVVVADVRGPGGVFSFLPAVEVTAEAVAAKEQP